MAPHSSTLAWKIPWMEEEQPGGLQSMGSRRVGHDWATSLSLFTFMHRRRKWQPTPVSLPGEFQGWGSLVGCRLWGRTESDQVKRLSSSSSIGLEELMGRIESPETDQNILENLTKSGQSGLYDKWYWLTKPLTYTESYISTSHTHKFISYGLKTLNILNKIITNTLDEILRRYFYYLVLRISL